MTCGRATDQDSPAARVYRVVLVGAVVADDVVTVGRGEVTRLDAGDLHVTVVLLPLDVRAVRGEPGDHGDEKQRQDPDAPQPCEATLVLYHGGAASPQSASVFFAPGRIALLGVESPNGSAGAGGGPGSYFAWYCLAGLSRGFFLFGWSPE